MYNLKCTVKLAFPLKKKMLIKANESLKIYIAADMLLRTDKREKKTWSFLKRILY